MRLTETQQRLMKEISEVPILAEYCRMKMSTLYHLYKGEELSRQLSKLLRECARALYNY